MSRLALLAIAMNVALAVRPCAGHDIPNARVDRSIQVDLSPAGLLIEYEVSLSELTLTQDLRGLVGSLPGGDRQAWFQKYGEVTGPLNAKGFLVTVGDQTLDLKAEGFRLVVEDHPRFFFRFTTPLPSAGRLLIRDTNYAASEGTSRLAIRGLSGVELQADALPSDVGQIAIVPVWQLSNDEEKRTHEVLVAYRILPSGPVAPAPPAAEPVATVPVARNGGNALTKLLDAPDSSAAHWLWMGLTTFLLGAVHSLQPGHGKTLSFAGTVGAAHPWRSALLLGLSTTVAHMGTVLVIALGLLLSGATSYEAVHAPLVRTAGFAIAAAGLWRLGREVRGGDAERLESVSIRGDRELIGLGLAAGLVPCWEAIALLAIALSIGKFALGIYLVACFSLGLGLVLVALGGLASQVGRQVAAKGATAGRLLRRAGSVLLVILGLWFLAT